jgi:hypothetical protein
VHQVANLTDDLQTARAETADALKVASTKEAALAEVTQSAHKYRDALERVSSTCEAQRGVCAASWVCGEPNVCDVEVLDC